MLKHWVKVIIYILTTNISVSQDHKDTSITTYIDSIASLEKPTNNILMLAKKKLLRYDTITFIKELGDAYYKLGKLYNKKKQYTKAIAVSKKAVRLLKKTKDTFLLHKTLNNLYYYYTFLKGVGNYIEDSKKNQLIVLHQIINDKTYDKYTFGAYNKAAGIYIDNGDYYKALRYSDYVIKTPETHNYLKEFVVAHINSIEVYTKLKLDLNQLYIVEHHNSEIKKYSKHVKQKNIAKNNNNLAIIYAELELYKKAIIYYEKALRYFLETSNYEEIGDLYNNLGSTHSKLKNTQKATAYFNKALKVSNNIGVLSSVTHNKGFYLETTASIEKVPYYQSSMKYLLNDAYQYNSLHELPQINAIKESEYTVGILEDLIQIANTWVLSYKEDGDTLKLLNAKKTLFLIDEIISYIRFESSVDKSKLFWTNKGVDTYMLGVEVSYLLNDVESALYFMEKNKSLLLLENLNDKQTQEPAIITLDGIQKSHVSKTSNFIEYIINEKEGYGIFCSNTNTEFFKIKNLNEFLQQIETLKNQCNTHFTNKEDGSKYAKNAYAIFQKLFPFKNALQKISNKKLTIVSDFKIKNIPFEALITTNKSTDIKDNYLINKTEISYLYSASVFAQIQKKEYNPKSNILGIAPGIFIIDSLTPLKKSVQDIYKIASLFSTTLLEKEKATKEVVLSVMNDYKIIHFNTHAGIDPLTDEPWIALYDQKINLQELYQQPIQADLVVLDACKSATGKLEVGEGVMSLSRAFTYSGAKSVIASQWNVNEKALSTIFKTFYKELHKGTSKSKALHRAKLSYLNTHQLSEISPYYWASMTLSGDTKGVEIDQFSYKWLVFIFIGILGLFYFFYPKK